MKYELHSCFLAHESQYMTLKFYSKPARSFPELSSPMHFPDTFKNKQTPWPLVRKRTIPTERRPLVDEI
jgi:hypothetical protein